MASSFLEDLLEKEVDEKEVSAMVGSLESQLASTAIPSSSQNQVKAEVSAPKPDIKPTNVNTSQAPKQSSSSPSQPALIRAAIAPSGSTTTVINIAPRPTATPGVPLAPRPATMTVLSQTAGFAGSPRFVTAMINPNQLVNSNVNLINASQIALAPRIVSGGLTIPGAGQAIVPRVVQQIQPRGLNIGVSRPHVVVQGNPAMNPRMDGKAMTVGQGQIRPQIVQSHGVNQGQNVPMIRTSLSQARLPYSGVTPKSAVSYQPVRIVASTEHVNARTALSTTSHVRLTNASTLNSVSTGTVANADVRQQTLVNSVSQIQNSSVTNCAPQPAIPRTQNSGLSAPNSQLRVNKNTSAQLEAVKEQAMKLNNFFNNLIRLASEQRSPDVGHNVEALVQGVMEGKLTEEEFAAKLQTTLNSPPQPNLVGFLKKTLPMLRAQGCTQTPLQALQQQHIPQPSAPQKIIIQQQPCPARSNISSPQPASLPQLSTKQPNIQPQKIPTQQHVRIQQKIMLTPAQQQLLQRQQQLGNQRILLTGASTAGQLVSTSRGLVMIQAQPGTPRLTMTTAGKGQFMVAPASAADRAKPKAFTGISSSGDDDINDVTSMAGVNLMEESQRILAINSELLSSQTRSCKDEKYLNAEPLRKRLESLVRKYGLNDVSQDVCNIISHATQERLRNLMSKLSTISLHRLEVYRDDPLYDQSVDIKSQLRVFEQIDEVERKKREAREREVLMRAAKSRSRQEDPEQARLKEKAKQLQQEEEDILRKRAANSTALAAIGPRKKVRKLGDALEGATPSTQAMDNRTAEIRLNIQETVRQQHSQKLQAVDSASGSQISKSGQTNHLVARQQVTRQRTRRVILKDLVFVMEQEKETSKSSLLYKALLK